MQDGSISSFFYLELWLRPDGTLNFEQIVLPLCALRLQVPYQPGVRCKFLNQKCVRPRMMKNAHIWSMGAALMRALAALFPICCEDKSATVGHDTGVSKECRERNRPQVGGRDR